MAVTVTAQAVEIVRRALEMASAATDAGGVRIRMAGGAIRPRFATGPAPTDTVVDAEGVRIFVDEGVVAMADDIEIAVSAEHDELVVRPA